MLSLLGWLPRRWPPESKQWRLCALVDADSAASYGKVMDVTVQIPDDLASRMGAGDELPRRALEALAAEEYKRGRLTKPALRRLLGFETGDQIDEFLKEHEVFEEYTLEDLEREREGLRRLGF